MRTPGLWASRGDLATRAATAVVSADRMLHSSRRAELEREVARAQLVLQIGSASPADDLAQARLRAARTGVLDPDDTAVLTARGVVHTMAGERDIADALIERALAHSPRSR